MRLIPVTPLHKFYLINGDLALDGMYVVTDNVINVDDATIKIHDVLGVGAKLYPQPRERVELSQECSTPCGRGSPSPSDGHRRSERGPHITRDIQCPGTSSGSNPTFAYTPWASCVARSTRRTPRSSRWSRAAVARAVARPWPRAAGVT